MANSADPDQKPTDLDLHCLQRQGISGFSRARVKLCNNKHQIPLRGAPNYAYPRHMFPRGKTFIWIVLLSTAMVSAREDDFVQKWT